MSLKRSQIGLEFLIFVMFIFVVFVIFYIGVNSYRLDIIETEKGFLSRDIALLIHGEINLAYKAYDGFERNFTLPANLLGNALYTYNATISNYTLMVTTDRTETDFPVPIQSATLNLGGINRITKKNGELVIN